MEDRQGAMYKLYLILRALHINDIRISVILYIYYTYVMLDACSIGWT